MIPSPHPPAPLAPAPSVPAVDWRGWLPATSVVHTAGSMIVWHPYSAAGCECFDDLARPAPGHRPMTGNVIPFRMPPKIRAINPDDPPFPTCDWGGCDELTVAERWFPVHGWLPVCDIHQLAPDDHGASP